MTQREELLLVDISARLPYRVMVQTPELPFCMHSFVTDPIGNLHIDGSNICISYKDEKNNTITCSLDWPLWELRPFLRPMSSMTEEEKDECYALYAYVNGCYFPLCPWENTDFLNKHHLDYHGLIPMGLALPAKEGMYNI